MRLKYIGMIIRSAAALSLTSFGIWGSMKLKCSKFVSEEGFLALVAFSVLLGLFIAFSHRVKYFGLTKLELYEIKESEKNIKALSLAILEIIETKDHGIMQESYNHEAYQKAAAKLKSLAS